MFFKEVLIAYIQSVLIKYCNNGSDDEDGDDSICGTLFVIKTKQGCPNFFFFVQI